MKYALIPVAVVLAMVCAATGNAVTQAEQDAIVAEEAAKMSDFNDFKVAKAKVAVEEKAGNLEKVADMLEAIASDKEGHCAREGNEWVRAWQYNNAAFALIKANEKNGYTTPVKVLKRILSLLDKARLGANSSAMVKIVRNEDWANTRMPK